MIQPKRSILMALLPLLVLAWVDLGRAADEAPVELRARYSSVAGKAQPMLVLEFYTIKGDRRRLTASILDWKQGAPYDPATYTLTDAGGKKVDATPVAEQLGDELGDSVAFVLKNKLATGSKHTLKVAAGKMFFKLRTGMVSNAEVNLEISAEAIDKVNESMEEDKSGSSVNSIQLAGGTAGGIGEIRYTLRRYEFLNSSWLNMEVNASADFTLVSKDRNDYFNNITGEINFFRVFTSGKWPFEIGLHGKTESDQTFEVTDGLIGAKIATRLQDPITRWIGSVLQTNSHAPPLLIFGYDYAHNLGDNGPDTLSAIGVDTRAADHRLTGILRWRIPLATAYEFKLLPGLTGKYDLDLDLEAKGVYDINAEKVLDKSALSLVFRRTSDQKFKPAFSFTWARGKEGPTFNEVHALLAGMKLEF